MPAAHRRCDPSFPDFCVLFAGTGGAEWRFAAAQRSAKPAGSAEQAKALTPVEKLSQQDLTHTLELLDAIERNRQDAAQLKQQVQQAPAKLNQVTAELDALKRPTDNAAARAALLPLSLRQLESRLYQTLDELQSAQESLSTYNSQLVSLQTQPERVQSTMYAASQRLQEIRSQLSGQTPGQDSLRNSQQVMLNTEQALLNAQLELQRKSLEANTTLQDLLQKQRDYTTAHIDALDRSVQLLQELVNSKRLTLSEKPPKRRRIRKTPPISSTIGWSASSWTSTAS